MQNDVVLAAIGAFVFFGGIVAIIHVHAARSRRGHVLAMVEPFLGERIEVVRREGTTLFLRAGGAPVELELHELGRPRLYAASARAAVALGPLPQLWVAAHLDREIALAEKGLHGPMLHEGVLGTQGIALEIVCDGQQVDVRGNLSADRMGSLVLLAAGVAIAGAVELDRLSRAWSLGPRGERKTLELPVLGRDVRASIERGIALEVEGAHGLPPGTIPVARALELLRDAPRAERRGELAPGLERAPITPREGALALVLPLGTPSDDVARAAALLAEIVSSVPSAGAFR